MEKLDLSKFKTVYQNYYMLHPDGDTVPKYKLYYLHRQWFFPNHIDLVLSNILKFQKTYLPEANLTIALYAGLLHDAGLVYERETADPDGHENRSIVYAQKVLSLENYNVDFISQVCKAIGATDSNERPETVEGELVRNADAYSHLSSIHFIAKAYFSQELDEYLEWFEKKVNSTFNKLTIKELQDKVEPTVNIYHTMLQQYKSSKESSFIQKI